MPPERVVDVLALVGDSVDNVPGVPGIGEKGARDLVREFGSVEDVLANADKVKRTAYREGLKAHAEDALLSKRLVTLRTDAAGDPRPGGRCRRAARPRGRPRAVHRARVRRPGQGVRPRGEPEPHRPARRVRAEEVGAAAAEARRAGQVAVVLSCATAREPMLARSPRRGPVAAGGRGRVRAHRHGALEDPGAMPGPEVLDAAAPLFEDPQVRSSRAPASTTASCCRPRRPRLRVAGLRRPGGLLPAEPRQADVSLDDLALEFLGERPRRHRPHRAARSRRR